MGGPYSAIALIVVVGIEPRPRCSFIPTASSGAFLSVSKRSAPPAPFPFVARRVALRDQPVVGRERLEIEPCHPAPILSVLTRSIRRSRQPRNRCEKGIELKDDKPYIMTCADAALSDIGYIQNAASTGTDLPVYF